MLNYEIPVHGHEGELCSSVGALKPYSMPGSLSVQNVTVSKWHAETVRNHLQQSPFSAISDLCFSLWSLFLRQVTNRIAKPFNSQQVTSWRTRVSRLLFSPSEFSFSEEIKHPLGTQAMRRRKTDILRSHLSHRCCYIQRSGAVGKRAVTSGSLIKLYSI